MKIGSNKLRMSSGEVRHFKSEGARDRFERVAQWFKHNPQQAKSVLGRKGKR